MELKITDFQAPGKISFNYEELKQQIQTVKKTMLFGIF